MSLLLLDNNNNQDEADKDARNCYKLNANPSPYFDGGIYEATKLGTFHYMSTRNNNFSNRSQKGKIVVNPLYSPGEVSAIVLGSLTLVGLAGGAGGFMYAKKFPGSSVAGFYNKALNHPLLTRFK